MIPTSNDFIRLIREVAQNEQDFIQYGTIDPNYVSGQPQIQFDGEDGVSVKSYPFLSSYTPAPNDRVMILGGVIIGKLM